MRFLVLTKRQMIAALCCVLIAGVAAVIAVTTAGKVASVMGEVREIPIYYVDTDEKVCALSFDAAWGNEQTDRLLGILDEYKVKSTFFLVRQWVDQYPDDVRHIAERGHDVENHSATHPHMAQLSASQQMEEVTACNEAITKLTGKCPTLFRAPYGEYDDKLVQGLRAKQMYCVQWNIDSLDWKDPSPQEIVETVERKLCPGSIILMHNGATNTPEALPMVIETILNMGYRIVPVSELIPPGDYTTDHEGKMILTEKPSSAKPTQQNTENKKAHAPSASAFVYPSLVRAQRAAERGL